MRSVEVLDDKIVQVEEHGEKHTNNKCKECVREGKKETSRAARLKSLNWKYNVIEENCQ